MQSTTVVANPFALMIEPEAIFAAIAERNPNEARRAMRRHLYHVEEHLTSDEPGTPREPTPAKATRSRKAAPDKEAEAHPVA